MGDMVVLAMILASLGFVVWTLAPFWRAFRAEKEDRARLARHLREIDQAEPDPDPGLPRFVIVPARVFPSDMARLRARNLKEITEELLRYSTAEQEIKAKQQAHALREWNGDGRKPS
jgi:hypothetical protein